MKYILIIAAVILSLTGYAQLPEAQRGEDNVISQDANVHVTNIATIPADTITTAATNSIAIKNGVFYIKRTYWEPVNGIVTITTSQRIFLVDDSTNTQPVSTPDDSTYYLLGGAPAGVDWGAFPAHSIALYTTAGGWEFITGAINDYAITIDDQKYHQFNGTTWPLVSGIPLLTIGNIGPVRAGTTNASIFRIISANTARITVAANGDITFNKLTGSDTAFMMLGPGGVAYRRFPEATIDTTDVKPIGTSVTGKPYRLTYWPGGGGGGSSYSAGYGLNLTSTTFKVDTTKIQTKLGWFDFVQDFAGDSTGATDNTAKMQLALEYAAARGGGVIYVRNGTYLFSDSIRTVSGSNIINRAQVYLPYTAWSGVNKAHVVILGETPPVQYTSRRQTVPTTKGVIFKSTITDAAGGAVIGTAYNTDADNPGGFNFNQLTIENIQITVRSKTSGGTDTVPTIGAINADHMGYVTVEHSVLNSESAMASTVEPTSNIGFKGPGNGNWARVYLNDVAVYNFYTGIQVSEHFSGVQVYVATCVNGVELITGTHSVNFVRPLIQWCVNNVKISGQSYFKFDNLDIESYSTLSGNPSKWYLPSLDVYEPSTTSSVGLIHYQKTISNSGVSNSTFSVSGTLSTEIKYRIVNDFYSSLGINTNSPQNKLHVLGTAVPSFPTIQANDFEIGENSTDYFRSFVVGTTRTAGFRFYKSGAATSQGSIKYEMTTDQMDFYTNQNVTPRMSITSTGAVNFVGNINVASGKLFVDATGLVGVGTASPVRTLHVQGGAATDPANLGAADYVFVESAGNTAIAISSGTTAIGGIKFYENGQAGQQKGSIYYDQNTDQFRFTTNGTDVTSTSNFLITSAGDVGIGTGLTVNSKFQNTGSIAPGAYRAITTGRTLDGTDYVIDYSGAGGHTVTLPTAVGLTGRRYIIENNSTSYLAMATTSSQTINGFTTTTIAPGNTLIVTSDNANWKVETKSGDNNSRVSTQFDATSTTTLANVTGLTGNVTAGKTYRFEAKLYTTSDVAAGVKVAIAGTATATNIIYEGLTTNAGTITQGRGTALATAVGSVTAVTAAYIEINGTITVNAAGTLTVQFAQNASNATPSSVLVGSTFVITEIL